MKKIKIGINGFGRIGRAICRINEEKNLFDIVHVNDINPDIKNIAYLLQYDTTYGRNKLSVSNTGNSLVINDKEITVSHLAKIEAVPWKDYGVDIVVDSSGIKANLDVITKKDLGIKNLVVTNSPEGFEDIKTIIFGVNDNDCDPENTKVFSSSICDTVALAPIIKLLSESHNIQHGFLTTLHPWLSYQNLLDGPSVSWSQPGDVYSHYALGRASSQNIIPKSTSAIKAADKVFPDLSSKVSSFSYRVPTEIVSSGVLTLTLDKDISETEIKKRFEEFSNKQNTSVLLNSEEPLTSIDYKGMEYSLIVDHRWTEVVNDRNIRIVYWYDNEWGYSSKVVDLIVKLSESY